MSVAVLVAIICVLGAVIGVLLWREVKQRSAITPSRKRILFPFIGQALSIRALDATLRVAKAEGATLVPAYLARVPLRLPLGAPLPRQCDAAFPLLEAIEQRAMSQGVPVDARIESGRNYRHAIRQLLEHEAFDRIVVPGSSEHHEGFDADDVAWLLDNAPGEIIVVRPGDDRRLTIANGRGRGGLTLANGSGAEAR